MKTKISIVTISYNDCQGLKKTMESVRMQKYSNIEYIVIDGGSKDGTTDLLKKNPWISHYVSEPDYGISDAFNKGLEYVSGEIVMFLNSGDVLLNESVISKIITDWEQYPVDVLICKVRMEDGRTIPDVRYQDDGNKIWNALEMPHQGTFVRREVFQKVGYFNICVKIRMDLDFFARCKQMNCSYRYIPMEVVEYEIGGVSMSPVNAHRFNIEGLGVKLIYGYDLTWTELKNYLKWFIKNKKKDIFGRERE